MKPGSPNDMRMVADIGGTNTRIAQFNPQTGSFSELTTYVNRDHKSLQHIIQLWLDELETPRPAQSCIAIAAPPDNDRVSMTNIDWSFSRRELADHFQFSKFRWLNDFEAVAHALPHLAEGDTELLNDGILQHQGKLATMGPGTGLGGATLEWFDGRPYANASEPGHMGLSPATELELAIFELLQVHHGEIHTELLVSGGGLTRLHQSLAQIRGETNIAQLSPAQVSRRALQAEDECCVLALDIFCGLLGSACGDYVLANGAYGGLYLAGGIVPRIVPFLKQSAFARRFREKGAMEQHLEAVPLYVITEPLPALLGAAFAPMPS